MIKNYLIFLFIYYFYVNLLNATEDVDLCKRKPYLLFCNEQKSEFKDSRQSSVASDTFVQPQRGIRPYRYYDANSNLNAEKHSISKNFPYVPPVIKYHDKDYSGPIDMSRPNAEDVAREIGGIQLHDDPISTNKIPDFSSGSISNDVFEATTPFSTSTTSYNTPAPKNQLENTSSSMHSSVKSTVNKRLHDWIYLDDTDDLDYYAYRLKRARLLRKLNDLDEDQQKQKSIEILDHYDTTSPYQSYTRFYRARGYYPYSSYYPSSYYSNGYPSYGNSPSYNYGNPGYMGGGYGQPFSLGIGWGVNVGAFGVPVGVGSGFGVNVG